jgi:hypothetical protein
MLIGTDILIQRRHRGTVRFAHCSEAHFACRAQARSDYRNDKLTMKQKGVERENCCSMQRRSCCCQRALSRWGKGRPRGCTTLRHDAKCWRANSAETKPSFISSCDVVCLSSVDVGEGGLTTLDCGCQPLSSANWQGWRLLIHVQGMLYMSTTCIFISTAEDAGGV